MANVQNAPHIRLEDQYDYTNEKFLVEKDNDLATKKYVDDLVAGSGTEYTAGTNINITGDVIDTKRKVELTDITIADGQSVIKIVTTANGSPAIAEGADTTASGAFSHAEGTVTTASGNNSHSEGLGTTASGSSSHAEGNNTTASNSCSHSEGQGTIASGGFSHSEGYDTISGGKYSHAEGSDTTALGQGSHSEGRGTIADSDYQHVSGKYNIPDNSGNTLFIIGNGISTTNRSNAFTVGSSGEVYAKKGITGDFDFRNNTGATMDIDISLTDNKLKLIGLSESTAITLTADATNLESFGDETYRVRDFYFTNSSSSPITVTIATDSTLTARFMNGAESIAIPASSTTRVTITTFKYSEDTVDCIVEQ